MSTQAYTSPVCSDGDEIIRQGDKGDDFFIIQEGVVLVQINGEVVTELGSGAYFGELALLSNQRRAATVIAKGNAVLKSLDRAVASHPSHPQNIPKAPPPPRGSHQRGQPPAREASRRTAQGRPLGGHSAGACPLAPPAGDKTRGAF